MFKNVREYSLSEENKVIKEKWWTRPPISDSPYSDKMFLPYVLSPEEGDIIICFENGQEIKRINNGSQDVFDNLPPICVDEKGEEINLSIYSKGIYFFDNDS